MSSIVPQRSDDDIVDGVIINKLHPLMLLHGIFKVLDFILVVSFFASTHWLLKETDIHPMFGLSIFLVRFLWHGIDLRVRKSLGIDTPKRKSTKKRD